MEFPSEYPPELPDDPVDEPAVDSSGSEDGEEEESSDEEEQEQEQEREEPRKKRRRKLSEHERELQKLVLKKDREKEKILHSTPKPVVEYQRPAYLTRVPNLADHNPTLFQSPATANQGLPAGGTVPPELLSAALAFRGCASDAQLDAVVKVLLTLEKPCLISGQRSHHGFLLGDGTGVGKTRTMLVAVKAMRHLCWIGPIVLWVTQNDSLKKDITQESEIVMGDGLRHQRLSVYQMSDIYALQQKMHEAADNEDEEEAAEIEDLLGRIRGIAVTTYSQLRNSDKRRGMLDWIAQREAGYADVKNMGAGFATVLIFDECHNAKNVKSMQASACIDIQQRLPGARVIYASATGGANPLELRYLIKMNFGGAFDIDRFMQDVDSTGVFGKEMFCYALASSGAYRSLMLGFQDVEFNIVTVDLTERQRRLWTFVVILLKHVLADSAIEDVREYWGLHLMAMRQVLCSFKVRKAFEIIRHHVDRGDAVVVGTVTTGEAIEKALESGENGGLRYMLLTMAVKYNLSLFTMKHAMATELERETGVAGAQIRACLRVHAMPQGLKNLFDLFEVPQKLGAALLKDRLLREGIDYAELTGISSVIARNKQLTDFNDDKLRVAILSRACSTGFSLHSDMRFVNQRRRVHLTLELAFGPHQVLQQLGRTNRANQRHPPYHYLITTNVPGEKRFTSAIERQLQELGALLHGHSGSNTKHFSSFHISEHGDDIISYMLEAFPELLDKLRSHPDRELRLSGTNQFFNRLLAQTLQDQEELLRAFDECVRKIQSGSRGFTLHCCRTDKRIKDMLRADAQRIPGTEVVVLQLRVRVVFQWAELTAYLADKDKDACAVLPAGRRRFQPLVIVGPSRKVLDDILLYSRDIDVSEIDLDKIESMYVCSPICFPRRMDPSLLHDIICRGESRRALRIRDMQKSDMELLRQHWSLSVSNHAPVRYNLLRGNLLPHWDVIVSMIKLNPSERTPRLQQLQLFERDELFRPDGGTSIVGIQLSDPQLESFKRQVTNKSAAT